MVIKMTLKEQWKTIKNNWILVLVLLILVVAPSFTGISSQFGLAKSYAGGYGVTYDMALEESAVRSFAPSYYYDDSFAPDIDQRIITKSASLSTEVKRGTFYANVDKLKSIVSSTDSFILNENINRYSYGRNSNREYLSGFFQLKVESSKLNAVLNQLKEIGTITSLSEDSQDITGSYTNLQVELAAEKNRLTRYQQMYSEAKTVEEKLQLSDRIFDQERTVKYLEDSIKNANQRVDYSTVYVTITEKQSEYVEAIFVKFSELVTRLVRGINNVFYLVFWTLPYAILAGLIWFIVIIYRKRH